MNRPIKFRAWDTRINKMFSWEDITNSSNGYCLSLTMILEYAKTNQLIPMQFTGLFDCNGKEICEGDILKISDLKGAFEMRWREDWACFAAYGGEQLRGIYPNDREWYCLSHFKIRDIEVIGNVFESPELLK